MLEPSSPGVQSSLPKFSPTKANPKIGELKLLRDKYLTCLTKHSLESKHSVHISSLFY